MKRTSHKRARKTWPSRIIGAELIIKDNLIHLDSSGRETVAIPALVILGNSQGFRYLARIFEYLADYTPVPPASAHETDPEDHQHLDVFDSARSDKVEIRLGHITSENRRQVFRKFAVSKTTADRRCLTRRYAECIHKARAALNPRAVANRSALSVTMGRSK